MRELKRRSSSSAEQQAIEEYLQEGVRLSQELDEVGG